MRSRTSRKYREVDTKQSFSVVCSDKMKYWDYEANSGISDPTHISPNSEFVVSWRCPYCDRKWKNTVASVSALQFPCKCRRAGISSSFPEQFIYLALCEVLGSDKVKHRDKTVLGCEIDVLIDSYRFGIEFGSWKWHKERVDQDKVKIEKAISAGISLYCIYDNVPSECKAEQSHAILIDEKISNRHYEQLKEELCKIMDNEGVPHNEIDWKSIADIATKAVVANTVPTEKSLAARCPNSLKEWDYDKNAPITPYDVYASSEHAYYFLCEEGHSYESTPDHKTRRNDGCPICHSVQLIADINSFAAKQPTLMRYWDWDKNEEDPYAIFEQTNNKTCWYWKCPECGEEWTTASSQTMIRYPRDEYCPKCKQTKTLVEHLSEIHFSVQIKDFYVADSVFPNGDIKKDKMYRSSLEAFVRQHIEENMNYVTGNHKHWILETPTSYIVIAKDTHSCGTIKQCYLSSSLLGKKTKIDSKGKASFANIVPTDVSFATRNPDVMPYWDWEANSKNPYQIPDNIQAQKEWHWKCPRCGQQWKTTRPIKNGGNASFFCRNCYLRDKLSDMLEKSKIHFYDVTAVNGQRNIAISAVLADLLFRVANCNEGKIDQKKGHLIIDINTAHIVITIQQGVVQEATGV